MTACTIAITAREQAELVPEEEPATIGPDQVYGRTVVTLVSPGTELAANYRGSSFGFPNYPGYAAVFRAEKIGREVEDLQTGDLLLCMGRHRSFQQVRADRTLKVPEGLRPDQAVIARLMGVTMTTLMTTTARPGDLVIVTGAGPIGYLAAHIFNNSGYAVCVIEPDESRQEIVRDSGIEAVYPSVPVDDPAIAGTVALVVECSGHEGATLDGCRIARKGGEVVLVGVPWERRTDLFAHELLSRVFHNYVVLRSGWEWGLPRQSADFQPHSVFGVLRLALEWLARGRIPLEGLISINSPRDAQSVYQRLLHRQSEGLFQLFDWQLF